MSKPLPSNEAAECAILGGIILNNDLTSEVFSTLVPEDFYSPLHRRIAEAMLALYQTARPIDPITIAEQMKTEGSIESLGGVTRIAGLTDGLPFFTNLKEYIVTVKTHSVARRAIRMFGQTMADLVEQAEPVDKLLARAAHNLTTLQEYHTKSGTQSLAQVTGEVRKIFRQWKEGNMSASSLPTGINPLDTMLKFKGLAKGELTLICARPSIGKTALLLQIATQIVRCGHPLLFISLEMLRTRLVMRMLPPITKINNTAINPHTVKNVPEHLGLLEGALDDLEPKPMYFDRSFDISKVVAVIDHYVQSKKIEGFVFDYMTLFRNDLTNNKNSSRDSDIGYIVNELKECCIRHNIVGLGAAQLNRAIEKYNRPPRLSDIRETGIAEQTADVILFPWDRFAKDHIENPDLIKNSMELELLCGKQRDGERGWSVILNFDKNLQSFKAVARAPRPVTSGNGGNVPAGYRNYTDTDRDRDDEAI